MLYPFISELRLDCAETQKESHGFRWKRAVFTLINNVPQREFNSSSSLGNVIMKTNEPIYSTLWTLNTDCFSCLILNFLMLCNSGGVSVTESTCYPQHLRETLRKPERYDPDPKLAVDFNAWGLSSSSCQSTVLNSRWRDRFKHFTQICLAFPQNRITSTARTLDHQS